jgi:hypothetical protein
MSLMYVESRQGHGADSSADPAISFDTKPAAEIASCPLLLNAPSPDR